MKTKNLSGWLDDEEVKVKVLIDEEQGYITFVCGDYNETELVFDYHVIQQLGLEMKEILEK